MMHYQLGVTCWAEDIFPASFTTAYGAASCAVVDQAFKLQRTVLSRWQNEWQNDYRNGGHNGHLGEQIVP